MKIRTPRQRRMIESNFDGGGFDIPNLPKALGLATECQCGHVELVHEENRCNILSCGCRQFRAAGVDSLRTEETLP